RRIGARIGAAASRRNAFRHGAGIGGTDSSADSTAPFILPSRSLSILSRAAPQAVGTRAAISLRTSSR
ncbi:hypothetical protein, partial [Burkholderia multivorans]|uniref:hypothetical protein n=1 Tax=Burkholderia multivorans TaxID=87883 RepID=UPI0028708B2F